MVHDIITHDAYSMSWAEILEFSKSQRDIVDAVIISKRIVFDIICYVAYYSAAKFKLPIQQPSNMAAKCFILIIPRLMELWPFKCQGHIVSLWRWPLTCNLECYLLRSSLGMYNLERQLRYSHLLMRHCLCNLFPEPTLLVYSTSSITLGKKVCPQNGSHFQNV